MDLKSSKSGFGLAHIVGLAFTSMVGALMFIRFSYALGELGLIGTLLVVLAGLGIAIPSALALSELATNQKVKGGGEYYIISRTFGLNLGAPIGIALFLSQAISIAFYIVVFTEAFEPLFLWSKDTFSKELPRQIISVPAMLMLVLLVIKFDSKKVIKVLFIVVGLIVFSLVLFFPVPDNYIPEAGMNIYSLQTGNIDTKFFLVFAIIFPAFTGLTTGIGLAGNLKNNTQQIPQGIIIASVAGFVIILLYSWKLVNSFSQDELLTNYQIVKRLTYFGQVIIPLAIAVSALYSAYLFMTIASKTITLLGLDDSLPIKSMNRMLSASKNSEKLPSGAIFLVSIIAMIFVLKGGVDYLASIISMLFIITYTSLCLVSFLYHFGSDPSYRPIFSSKWYLSLTGFLLGIFMMFKMNVYYANIAIIVMVILYIIVNRKHKDRAGVRNLLLGVLFQANRSIQLQIQKLSSKNNGFPWRPSVICVSDKTFEKHGTLQLLEWISYRYGFATYLHFIENNFSTISYKESQELKNNLVTQKGLNSRVYVDTLVATSYSVAVSQAIQLPGISGMPNNLIVFEIDNNDRQAFHLLSEDISLAKAANLDILVFSGLEHKINFSKGIDIWLDSSDFRNSNLMILLGYIILGHPSWQKSFIRIFELVPSGKADEFRKSIIETIRNGQIPITEENIEMIELNPDSDNKKIICERSSKAGLVIVGFSEEQLMHNVSLYTDYSNLEEILFVSTSEAKKLE